MAVGETHGTQAERCVGPEGAGPRSGQPRWGWDGPLANSIRRLKPAATRVRPLQGLHVSLSNSPTERVSSWPVFDFTTNLVGFLVALPQVLFDLLLVLKKI